MLTIPKQEVVDFLKSQYTMQMATATRSGKPQVSVMLFAIDDELNFYCATHSDSVKAKNLYENNKASLVIWEHKNMLVQVQGDVEIIKDEKQLAETLDRLGAAAAKDPAFWPPVLRISGDNYSVYKITPVKMSALDLHSDHIREEETPFTEII